jgi:1,4-dihydroxy-2-naphthoate octaprenyltransferase
MIISHFPFILFFLESGKKNKINKLHIFIFVILSCPFLVLSLLSVCVWWFSSVCLCLVVLFFERNRRERQGKTREQKTRNNEIKFIKKDKRTE